MLEIEVIEIKGYCPVHKVGDKIIIEGPRIVLEKIDALCIYVLSAILHYAVALDESADPVKLGLTKLEDKESAYLRSFYSYLLLDRFAIFRSVDEGAKLI